MALRRYQIWVLRWCAWAVVLVGLLPARGYAQRPEAPRDAGVVDASAGPDAAPPLVRAIPIESLRLRAHRFEDAASEGAELDVPLTTLFSFDLGNEAAIAQRVGHLEARLAALAVEVPGIADIETSSTSTRTAGLSQSRLAVALEYRALSLERAFLTLPKAQRDRRVQADATRRAHEQQELKAKDQVRISEAEKREAEAQRVKALQEADRADTETLKANKNAVAAVAQARAALAEQERAFAERRESRSKTSAESLKRLQSLLQLEAEAQNADLALAAFADVRSELLKAEDALEFALGRLRSSIELPEVSGAIREIAPGTSPEARAAHAELTEALVNFDRAANDLAKEQRAFRLHAVETAFDRLEALADARVRLLARLSPAERGKLRGLNRAGFAEARLEAELIALEGRATPVIRIDELRNAPNYARDVVSLGKTFWIAFKVLLVIFFALWLKRQGPGFATWFERYLRSQVRSVVWLRRTRFLIRNARRFGAYLLFLLTIHLVYWALGPLGESVEVDLLFTTVLWVAYYWLLRTWLTSIVQWLAEMRRVVIDAKLKAKLQNSTRLVGRAVLIYGLLSSVAVRILRVGILYHFAQLVLLAGVLLFFVVLVWRWREEIASAYTSKTPKSALARLLMSTRGNVLHIFVVLVALGIVVGRGLVVFANQFFLGFTQTRKAIAFVFRKRLERKAEKQGSRKIDISLLPESLPESFTLEPLEDPRLRVEFFPGLDKYHRKLAAWRDEDAKGSFVLIAGRGYGKTTWLKRAMGDAGGMEQIFLDLQRTDDTAQSLYDQLGAALELEGDMTEARLLEVLGSHTRRIIALDDIHRLFFRRMSGATAFDALMDLIEDTGRSVFWLCSVDRLAWRHICAARPTRIRFRAEQELSDWPEDKLRQLLMTRAAASGVAHEFEDLIVSADGEHQHEDLVNASEGYARLVWDYADGCPLVALRFWLYSLAPSGHNRVRVRLFEAPNDERLKEIPKEGVFLYAAVANHDALSSAEASGIVGFPEHICEAGLTRGVEEGYIVRVGDDRFGLAVDWQRQMIRFLRAHQAL